MKSIHEIDLYSSISITNDVFHNVTPDEVEMQSANLWTS